VLGRGGTFRRVEETAGRRQYNGEQKDT